MGCQLLISVGNAAACLLWVICGCLMIFVGITVQQLGLDYRRQLPLWKDFVIAAVGLFILPIISAVTAYSHVKYFTDIDKEDEKRKHDSNLIKTFYIKQIEPVVVHTRNIIEKQKKIHIQSQATQFNGPEKSLTQKSVQVDLKLPQNSKMEPENEQAPNDAQSVKSNKTSTLNETQSLQDDKSRINDHQAENWRFQNYYQVPRFVNPYMMWPQPEPVFVPPFNPYHFMSPPLPAQPPPMMPRFAVISEEKLN